MTDIENRIAAYHAVPFDEEGEAWPKVRIIEEMESYLGEEPILDFFLALVADTGEYDMVRIHLLKLFNCDPANSPSAHRRIGECIAETLLKEDDWLVKSWLAQAADVYHDVPTLRDVSAGRLLDRSESDEVRCGCLSVLERTGPTEQVLQVFRQLIRDEDSVAESVRRIMEEWRTA